MERAEGEREWVSDWEARIEEEIERVKLEYTGNKQYELENRQMEELFDQNELRLGKTYEEMAHCFMLEDNYRNAPCGHHLFRHSKHTIPLYFKFRHPINNLFLKQLGDAQVPWSKQHTYPKHAVESLAKDTVAFLLSQHCKTFSILRTLCKDANHGIIKAAASALCLCFTQDSLYKMGRKPTLKKQLDELWDQVELLDIKACTLNDVCKLLVRLMTDNHKYSFLTEPDLADMLSDCCIVLKLADSMQEIRKDDDEDTPELKALCFQRPLEYPFPREDEDENKDKDQVFIDITKIVREMESCPTIMEVDEYTILMMKLLREESTLQELDIIKDLETIAEVEHMDRGLHNSDFIISDLSCSLSYLLAYGKQMIQEQLLNVVQPLFYLCDPKHTHITEIVEVAELRRMALGNRFIGRSHLLWAFYQLGYALPPKTRKMIDVNAADEDHPPYHIYMAAMVLAESCGKKETKLEHFIFAVVHSKDIGFDGQQVIEMVEDFKIFQEDLETMETDTSDSSGSSEGCCA